MGKDRKGGFKIPKGRKGIYGKVGIERDKGYEVKCVKETKLWGS